MKRALIAIASVGFLTSTAWVVAANAQANINPNVYPGNTSGQYGAPQKWEWYAAPGPSKRGSMCVTHVDSTRGYGFQQPCPAPKAAASAAPRAAAPNAAASASTQALSARASAPPRAAAPTRKHKVVSR
jgi:hypothetical protein